MNYQKLVLKGFDMARDMENAKRLQREWYLRNKEKTKERAREWNAENPDKRKQYRDKWREANRDRHNATNRDWNSRNQHKKTAYEGKRRAAQLQRTPNWLSPADLQIIEEMYHLAKLCTEIFGISWHVDHILPLQGKKVSGLHVPANLQVIPAKLNLQKSNKHHE